MPATVIAERIGWGHGMTVLKDRVRELRPLFRPPDPCQRTHYLPGQLAQWDLWQPDIAIPLGHGQADKLAGSDSRCSSVGCKLRASTLRGRWSPRSE